MALDGFSSVAVTTMITLAIVDLHVELVAGAAAWTAGWWLLREPGPRCGDAPRHRGRRRHRAPEAASLGGQDREHHPEVRSLRALDEVEPPAGTLGRGPGDGQAQTAAGHPGAP